MAQDDMKAENFSKAKEMALSHIDKRLTLDQAHRSCVSAASDREALKACREKHQTSMQSLKSDRKGMKEKFREGRKDRRKDKKKD